MEEQTGILVIVGICAAVLLIGAFKKRAEWVLNFLLRTVFGTIAVFLINSCMIKAGLESGIGLNPITVLTPGILGFPGLALLYGIFFYKLL